MDWPSFNHRSYLPPDQFPQLVNNFRGFQGRKSNLKHIVLLPIVLQFLRIFSVFNKVEHNRLIVNQ